MPAPTVFISYSHQDEAWMKKLLPHLHSLEMAGIGMQVWHDRKIDGGDKWYPEIQEAMANAAAAILLISSDFLASRFCVLEEVPALIKRQEEEGMLLIPLLLRQCPWNAHRWLKDRQMLPRDGKCIAIDFAGDYADVIFSQAAAQVRDFLLERATRTLAPATLPRVVEQLLAVRAATPSPPPSEPDRELAWPTLPSGHIDLTRLPETGSALFGRNEELALLDKAWAAPGPTGRTPVRILAFTAHGGVGKSTLVNHWLADMARDDYRGATRVLGWSFYSQGVRQETAGSADSFIDTALRFFGDADPTVGSRWEKGERLAGLVGSHRSLLVLDGLEPLQSAHLFERGKLRDAALESLLRGLARQSAGLCLITTREPLVGLAGRPGVTMCDLEQITPQAGRALLRTARVIGTDAELESLASQFGPHALAVSLLGVYLREQPGHTIGPAQALGQLPGDKPIDRVLAGFELWLGDSPERDALRLLAFFDGPANAGCLRALLRTPAISGLTDCVAGMDDTEWNRVLARLEKLRLIHLQHGEPGHQTVDAHPLVREHFAELLKGGESWRAAHRRIYEHLCASTPDKPQPTLEDLQPLYQAVAHGCQAGMQQEACDTVFWARIKRRDEHYSSKKLGAFGSDLQAVACFFEEPWTIVSPALSEAYQAVLLSEAALCLRSLGRLTEAVKPMRAGSEMFIKQENWEQAAISANNLSELELTLGEVVGAVGEAEQAATYADRSSSAYLRLALRTTHADALHHAGRRTEAEARFREAEAMQAEDQPVYPLLYSLWGFRYWDLLLTEAERGAWHVLLRIAGFEPVTLTESASSGNARSSPSGPTPSAAHEARRSGQAARAPQIQSCGAVERRAAHTLQWTETSRGVSALDIATIHLTQGRAALYAAILENSTIGQPQSAIDQAVDGFRRAGTHDHLPRGLLTRAWQRFRECKRTGLESAQSDLDEAWEIAERGPMPLFITDIHLHRARLFFREAHYPWASPQHDLAEARRLIEKHGYLRRMEELADAESVIL